ncbi:MAG: hypothetical protein K8S56_02620 [Candidatus Cloacimonetes bacterium]|nr:hypothetical protein [Candidatus Cloacimonadota bacterium]
MSKHESNLIDFVITTARYKRFIFISMLVISAAVVTYSLLTPKFWIAKASILPAKRSSANLPVSGGSLMEISSSVLGSGGSKEAINLVEIMTSRFFSEAVVRKFNLIEYFEINIPDSLIALDAALLGLREQIRSISLKEESSLISIIIETRSQELSRDIANFYWQYLEQYNQKYRITKGKEKRIFLEQRVKETEMKIDSLTMAYARFRSDNNTIELEEQTKGIIRIYAEALSSVVELEMEISYTEKYVSDDVQMLDNLKTQRTILLEKIAQYEKIDMPSSGNYMLKLDNIPEITRQVVQFEFELTILTKLYEFIYLQFENARLEELEDRATIEVLDIARTPGQRTKPKRAQLCIMVFFIGLLINLIFVQVFDRFRIMSQQEEFSDKLRLLKELLRIRQSSS